jgi:SAM-dependent methyltransferase
MVTDANDYLEINRKSWNNRTDAHYKSAFYDVEGFLQGNTSLNEIELAMLGDLRGKKVLHLQCHFGQDTLSLARMGAEVVGVDLSDEAITRANHLAASIGTAATFICCDIYDLPQHLDQQFDLVFTTYGTIGWLPDLNKWGKIIAQFLKPGGRLVFVEFHPVIWMFDDNFEKIHYDYFNTGPIIETESGTYADKAAQIQQKYVMWNHGLNEVFHGLIDNGLQINTFEEYDYSPYDCLNNLEAQEAKKYRFKHVKHRIPMVYSIEATKP